jgi:hypothetical protein
MAIRLIATTQVHENYGSHDWNGEGECPQYWKAKGGQDYLVAELSVEDASKGEAYLQGLVDASLSQMESNNDYWREYVLGWELFPEGKLTYMEGLYADHGDDPSRVVQALEVTA